MEPAPSSGSQRADSPDGSDKPRIKVQLYKTEPCQNWSLYGICRYGNLCKFAHGVSEQRSRLRHPKYKTSLCKDLPLGRCTFGSRCNFAHSLDELRGPIPGSAIHAGCSPETALLSTMPAVDTDRFCVGDWSKAACPDNLLLRTADSRLPAVTRVAGDLRRNQSMGTLRPVRTSVSHNALLAADPPPASSVATVHSHEIAGAASVAVRIASAVSNQTSAPSQSERLSSSAASQHGHYNYYEQQNCPDMAKQPLHYLQKDQVARRVASLSQLPRLRKTAASFSPKIATAPSTSGQFLQSFHIATPVPSPTVSHQPLLYRISPLSQVPPIEAVSPALSSASHWEFEDSGVPLSQSDLGVLAAENLRAQQSQQNYFTSAATLPQVAINVQHHQRRTLTASVSMQALPRHSAATDWDQHRHSPQPANLSLSSSIPTSRSVVSSQNSATTIADPDMWPRAAPYKGFNLEPPPTKPQESRFFPLSATAATMNETPTANSGLATSIGALGIYQDGTCIQSNWQQQLRRQQSTDDWTLLRTTARQHPLSAYKPSPPPNNGNLSNGLMDSRLYSLEQLRTATSTRKQFNTSTFL